MDEKVVITGAGVVTSLGLTLDETWNSLVAGKKGIHTITGFNADEFPCSLAAEVKGLGPEELNIHPRDSRIMDKHAYMLMKCSRDACTQSRIDTNSEPPEDIGFFAGMGMIDYDVKALLPAVLASLDDQGALDYDRFFSYGYRKIHPLWPLSMLNNIGFCQVSIDLGLKGENTVFSPHADSGIHAIIEAVNSVSDRKSRIALAGGVSETVSPLSINRASLSGILNTTDNNNNIPCSPFGKNRKGTILGEGCGILSLELISSAKRRQLPLLASITGHGASFEIMEGTDCPTTDAVRMSMDRALARADSVPSDIDVIIAHGDGTKAGDRNEIEAIHQTFSDCISKIRVYSSKGSLGHMMAGSPAVDVILGICMLKNGIIPASCGSLPLDDDIPFTVECREPLKADIKRILINSRSHEGQCASLIIEKVY